MTDQIKNNKNKELSKIFESMSNCYKYLGPTERFRAIAYENVSKLLGNMKESVESYDHEIKNLDKLKGIGESIAEKIIEFIDTGKIKVYEDLKKKIPYELFDLMKVEGIGPSTIKMIHDNLKVETREQLIDNIKNNKLEEIKGIGIKKTELIKKGLNIYEEKKRIPLKDASITASKILSRINEIDGIKKAVIAGSIRRKKDFIGDIDIVLASDKNKISKIIKNIINIPLFSETLMKGPTKLSMIIKDKSLQCDIRLVNENQFGAALLYFTGSKEHNIILRSIARKKGMKINEYGVFEIKTNKRLGGETENEVYDLLGLEYVNPENRTGKDEFKVIAAQT